LLLVNTGKSVTKNDSATVIMAPFKNGKVTLTLPAAKRNRLQTERKNRIDAQAAAVAETKPATTEKPQPSAPSQWKFWASRPSSNEPQTPQKDPAEQSISSFM
jgi:hypothetical protein